MTKKALVMRSTGSWYDVLDENHQIRKARTRGKLKLQGLKVTNPIAVGDYVLYEEEGEQNLVIYQILERENCIVRKATHKSHHAHIIAANIDQCLLIATLAMPRTSLGFIDRFLVSAQSFGIEAVLVFNKSDLLEEQDLELLDEIMGIYQKIGYQSVAISAIKDQDLEALNQILEGKKTLIAGHSGVGKSTIVNRIAPDLHQKTAFVSDFSQKGVHTTTFAEMFEIRKDTFFIDTPGIKELGLMDIDKEEIAHFFPEMEAVLGECKYYNCTHLHEPNCKVLEMVEAGEIAVSRYQSYVSMFHDEDIFR